jgi:hypothetical protein
MRLIMRMWIRILIATGAYICVVFVTNRLADVVAGCLIVLWLPGAVWFEFFLDRLASRWWEQLAVTVLLSASISILIGLVLDLLPTGLDRKTEFIGWLSVTAAGLIPSGFLSSRRRSAVSDDADKAPDHSSHSGLLSSISRSAGERKWALASGLATFALFAGAVSLSLISSRHASSENPITTLSAMPMKGPGVEVVATSTNASSEPYIIVLIGGASSRQVLRADIRAAKPWVHVVEAPTFPFRAQLWQSRSGKRVLVRQIRLVGT